ncbi:hypothetical protein ASE01_19740 [Nocardioides sp. Root190]|nr:hypothetical protein ASE01_19740 [Nocardioides sp. Root190]
MIVALSAAVVLVALMAWWLSREDVGPPPAAEPAPVAVPTPTPTPTPTPPVDPCATQARAGFVPTTISVEGVTGRAAVVGLPRDGAGVPGVPPIADKEVFAWDLGGIEPGSDEGHVLLNTHTWPDGSAMGNRLLAELEVGDELRLGRPGKVACYRVSERREVRVEDGAPGWSAKDGPPEVVIVVCSGQRRGPGDWSHRTLWFAEPVLAETAPAETAPVS